MFVCFSSRASRHHLVIVVGHTLVVYKSESLLCRVFQDMAQQLNANGRSTGPGRDDDKKLFVGGLGRTISEKELREYFTQYGEIENINIKTDPMSGQSRGFAFIQFVNAKTVDDLLAAGDHFIANKKVDPKRVSFIKYILSKSLS